MRKIFYIHFWLIIIYFLKNIFIKNYPKIMALEESSKLRWWIFIHQSSLFPLFLIAWIRCLMVAFWFKFLTMVSWLVIGCVLVGWWFDGRDYILCSRSDAHSILYIYGSPNRITRVHIHNMFEHWKDSVQSFYLFHLLFFIYRLF